MQPIHRFALVTVGLTAGLCLGTPLAADPRPLEARTGPRVTLRAEKELDAEERGVPLVVWNRRITVFRVPFEDWDPAERAERAAARILAVPAEQGAWTVAHQPTRVGNYSGFVFTVNGEFAFRLLEGDEDREAGETLEQAARAAEARLREAMDSRIRQSRWPVILKGVLFSIAATLVLFASLFLFVRLKRKLQSSLDPHVTRARARAVVGGINVWPILGGLRQVIAGIFSYLWLEFVFHQFPYTEPWGRALGGFLVQVISTFGWGILASLPGLFAVLVVFALAHAFNRGVGSYFRAVERGEVAVSWLAVESARATRQLLALLTWVFALVVAYPYIPGSDTAAFKGVTVFLGLMVSLGSAGLVNQIMSGLAVIYSGAYHRDDYVSIGEQEGRVRNLGLLATRIEKAGGAEVSIPNAVVAANTTTNFSRGGEGRCEILTTSITIGYDVPWRQVHGLLRLAAQRTPELASTPVPTVLQHALSDFYVEYQIFAHLARREGRGAALSRLHAEIQDAFNEHGVQIMSPHFEGQPGREVIVPREAWFRSPSDAEETRPSTPAPPLDRSSVGADP
jgi:small-conductance mechanosensitive channel